MSSYLILLDALKVCTVCVTPPHRRAHSPNTAAWCEVPIQLFQITTHACMHGVHGEFRLFRSLTIRAADASSRPVTLRVASMTPALPQPACSFRDPHTAAHSTWHIGPIRSVRSVSPTLVPSDSFHSTAINKSRSSSCYKRSPIYRERTRRGADAGQRLSRRHFTKCSAQWAAGTTYV